MKISYIFLFIIFCGIIRAQEVQVKDSLFFTQKELPSAEFMRRDVYLPGTLWGYIDGGADIYFEYGFEKAVVEDIRLKGMAFKSEIYQMSDNASAYGIFSISKSRCREQDPSEIHSCITNYQVQYLRGKYHISIINETGSAEARNAGKELAKLILNKLPRDSHKLPDLFYTNKLNSFKEDVRLIQGPLGIQNTLPELEDKFQNLSNYEVYYLPLETAQGNLSIYYSIFKDAADPAKFVSAFKPSEKSLSKDRTNRLNFYNINEHTILLIESDLSNDIYDSYIYSFNLSIK